MSVTDVDRENAKRVLWQGTVLGTEERVAAALAAEREKARAPFLALADEYDANINWREWGIGSRIRHHAKDKL